MRTCIHTHTHTPTYRRYEPEDIKIMYRFIETMPLNHTEEERQSEKDPLSINTPYTRFTLEQLQNAARDTRFALVIQFDVVPTSTSARVRCTTAVISFSRLGRGAQNRIFSPFDTKKTASLRVSRSNRAQPLDLPRHIQAK